MSRDFDDIPAIAEAWHRQGRQVALATVVQTWGSAPRPVGSLMAIADNGEMAGSVSGGCVEAAVVAEAMDSFETGAPRLLTYGVSDDDAFAVGLACGGTIRVLVEPLGEAMPVVMLGQLVAARAARRPIAYVVDTENWSRHLAGPVDFPDRFRSDRSGFEEDGKTFVAIHNPPLRMAVVGAVHIAQPLIQMAEIAGYDTVLIDPREAFASEGRFPGQAIDTNWPDEALAAFAPDQRTAVVTLTHDPKLDDPALLTALGTDVFYIGALGSERTHAKRIVRLMDAGVDESGLARIHAPVGLDIGAKSPAEIAISIMAEITQRLRKG